MLDAALKLARWILRHWQTLLKSYSVFALAHVLCKLLAQSLKVRRQQKMLRESGVKGGPHQMFGKDLVKNIKRRYDFTVDQMMEYRDEACIQLRGPNVALLANDPAIVKHFLKDNFENYPKAGADDDFIMDILNRWLGNEGIFVLQHGHGTPKLAEDHDLWHRQRKMASLIFTKNKFNSLMYNTFASKALTMNRRIHEESEYFDIQSYFFSFTMDSIQNVFFGRDVDTIGGSRSDKYASSFDEAHRYMVAFANEGIGPFNLCKFLPWPLSNMFDLEYRNSLPVKYMEATNANYRGFERNVQYLSDETYKIIKDLRNKRNKGVTTAAEGSNLISLFMNDPTVSDKQLRDIILNFIIAGRDTTACLLTWCIFELTQNPHVQEKLIAEIQAAFGLLRKGGQKDEVTVPTLEMLSEAKLPYLNGVMHETLRLHPPVPEDFKVCASDDTLPNGVRVAKGTFMVFAPYTMGRNPNLYPDPLKFDPERWIPYTAPNPFQFPVFQAGHRVCLGQNMAKFEFKLLMCVLLQEFSFTLKPGESDNITYAMMVTMALANSKNRETHSLWVKAEPHK